MPLGPSPLLVQTHIQHSLDMGQLRWLLTGGVAAVGEAPPNPAVRRATGVPTCCLATQAHTLPHRTPHTHTRTHSDVNMQTHTRKRARPAALAV